MLVNSGAEAVENAVKIARQATGRPGVLVFSGGFHGRTMMAMTLTSKVAYKEGCGPFAPEIYRVPFPDRLREGRGMSEDAFCAAELRELRNALETVASPKTLAAILVEPVQGEGGIIPIPQGYLEGLRALCDTHGILLILDEVQTGIGRTGAWAAHQRYGVTPDLSTYAKALGGGLPIGAVVGKKHVMDAALPGTIGGTFGGNPIACAAALATLDRIEELGLCARAIEQGEQIRQAFESLKSRFAEVVDVRGLGAMMALELCVDGDVHEPATELAGQVVAGCRDSGVLVIRAGVHANVLRILAPLVITDEQLARALDVIDIQLTRRLS